MIVGPGSFRVLLLIALSACGGQTTSTVRDGTGGLADPTDTVPPVFSFSPIEGTQPFGEDVTVSAEVSDADSGLFVVQLWYKNETDGNETYEARAMTSAGQDSPVWSGVIPGSAHRSGGMDYYLEAVDQSQNAATEPPDGPADPYHIRLSAL